MTSPISFPTAKPQSMPGWYRSLPRNDLWVVFAPDCSVCCCDLPPSPQEANFSSKIWFFWCLQKDFAHTLEAATQTTIVHNEIAYIMLCLSFGGSPESTDMVCCLQDDSRPVKWTSFVVGPKCIAKSRTTFGPRPKVWAWQKAFCYCSRNVCWHTLQVVGKTDAFIDYLIRVFLDIINDRTHESQAFPLAVYVTNWPYAGDNEPLPCHKILSKTSLLLRGPQ